MQQQITATDKDTFQLFVPMQIKRRGGSAMVIVPEYTEQDNAERYYDEGLIRAFARAYRWQVWLKKGKYQSLADICEKERISMTHGSRLYRLNFAAPHIVEAIVNGTQPRTLYLRDICVISRTSHFRTCGRSSWRGSGLSR